MISEIRLEDFKSYGSATLSFSPLTLFIGANASGKSNALEAIRLLSSLAKGSRLDDIERDINGAGSVFRGKAEGIFRHGTAKMALECIIYDRNNNWTLLSLGIGIVSQHLTLVSERLYNVDANLPLYELKQTANDYTDEVSVAYNNFKTGGNKPRIPCTDKQAIFYQLQTPARFGYSDKKSRELIPEVTNDLREALQKIVFLDPNPARMRGYAEISANVMEEDARNLSAVLFQICNIDTAQEKEDLLGFVRSLPEQDIARIDFIKTERNDVMVKLVETFGGKELAHDAASLSDGTLRVLAVAATLLTAERGSLVVIEELDNGVHPSRASMLIDQIRGVSQKRGLKVLLTTHNPALLDALPDDALGDVLFCYRDPETGFSSIKKLHDLQRFPELVARGPIGRLMTDRILESFVKDPTTAKERKEKALEWVEALGGG
ncbi:MAG: AAA family ATPase [Candidatus Hydrogenedentes bacterium]|nr:AAA family ATPase [Candidatus Hydrogenedentota bacterium]